MKKFAVALYENEAESDDELTFKKNDLLQVMQFDYMGMEGWWLCKLLKSNLTGLAAGNRLKVVTDEKILLKINTLISGDSKQSSIISTSSSSCSVVSSSSSSSSSSITSANSMEKSSPSRTQTVSLQPSSQLKQKLVLPAKNVPASKLGLVNNRNQNISASKSSFLTESTENILNLKSNLKKFQRNNSDSLQKSLTSLNLIGDETEPQHVIEENDDDDYDYDIPENNKPLVAPETTQLSQVKSNQNEARKSSSPTIDSGISTSSLQSLNTLNKTTNQTSQDDSLSTTSSSDSFNSQTSKSKNQAEYIYRIEQIANCCTRLLRYDGIERGLHTKQERKGNLILIRENLFELKDFVYQLLVNSLKNIKEEHACFHPNLNVFNRFKGFYRQIKEFYLYFDATMNTLTKVYSWNSELILHNGDEPGKKQTNEFDELVSKIGYLNETVNSMNTLIEEASLFDYNCQVSVTNYRSTDSSANKEMLNKEAPVNEYDYEYDNNNNSIQKAVPDATVAFKKPDDFDIYEKINDDDYADYCQIDDEPVESNKREMSYKTTNMPLCMTLKKNEEKIKREIKIAASHTNEASRINLVDQMLLKFYLKHIEDNLNELNSIYEHLFEKLTGDQSLEDELKEEDGLAHKLAINGHKLVFICDTLERNINSVALKAALYECSNSLCESLKLYMIRIKTNILNNHNGNSKKQQLIIESLKNVLNASNKFKQVIIKYYFKSY